MTSARPMVRRQAKSPVLSEQAFDAIRDKIVSLAIALGAAIEEERLATELGVGRTL